MQDRTVRTTKRARPRFLGPALLLALGACGPTGPLRKIAIGPDIVVLCQAVEPVTFTAFLVDDQGSARPYAMGFLGATEGEAGLRESPPRDASLRFRFRTSTEGAPQASSERWVAIAGPLRADDVVEEIDLGQGVAEYVHGGGCVELRVKVSKGEVRLNARVVAPDPAKGPVASN